MLQGADYGEQTARGPLRATKFFLTESIALSGIAVLPSLRIGVTSTDSHSIGVCALYQPLTSQGVWCTCLSLGKLVNGVWSDLAYLSSSKNGPNGLGDLRTDTVAFDKGYCVVSLQASQINP